MNRLRVDRGSAATAAMVIAWWPSMLPRPAFVQALLCGALLVIAWLFPARRPRLWWRMLCGVIGAGMLIAGYIWQNALRSALDQPATGVGYWIAAAVGTAAVAALGIGTCRLIANICRGHWRAASVVAIGALVIGQVIVAPSVWSWGAGYFASADARTLVELSVPLSPNRSGSASSAIGWAQLGAHGRDFVTQPGRSARVYAGLTSADGPDARAQLAVADLRRVGGFDRAALVIVVPTGSGWIDANAVAGIEERFGGEVSIVASQYSSAPSWVGYLFDREAAIREAHALTDAVTTALAARANPPKLFLYGQSLGALAVDSVLPSTAYCGALVAGLPGGRVPHVPRVTVLDNASDPVPVFTLRTLWRPPSKTNYGTQLPRPLWLPIVSWMQSAADMVAALSVPAGSGHRYGTNQGTAMPDC